MKAISLLPLVLFTINLSAQSTVPAQPPRTITVLPQEEFFSNRPSTAPTSLGHEDYRIGKDDLVDVAVFEVPDLGATLRVTAGGTISLPLVGRIDAAGRTTQELERGIEDALKSNYVKDPHVTVFVREYASQPVSVIGAVKFPGIYQIKGQKSLLDVLAMAQGIDQNVGNTIQIMRRASASEPASAGVVSETITVSVQDLFENGNTALNVSVFAGDVINVLHAGSVFVVGEVVRPNEFVLRNGRNISVTQAVALANGFTRDAKKQECVVIRYHQDGTKEELHADVDRILRGDAVDVLMLPNDILFVPPHKVKTGANRALDSAIAVISGRLIFGFR